MKRHRIATGLAFVFALACPAAWPPRPRPAPAGKVNINTATGSSSPRCPAWARSSRPASSSTARSRAASRSVQELMNVKGIGEKNFAKLQPHLTVGRGRRRRRHAR